MKRTLAISLIAALISSAAFAADEASEFATPTIDLGCVVSDIEASVKFYTEAIGFKQVTGFKVPGDFATDAGLTENRALDIKVLVLGEGDGATKLKLMQVPGSPSKKADHSTIDAQLGFSYLTVVVKSTDAALARLASAGVKPIAKGPVPLPSNLNPALSLTIVRDPDGNLVELVGPNPTK